MKADVAIGREMACGLDEPLITFVNQIQEWDAELAITPGVRDDEPKAAFDERVARRVVLLLLNATSEFSFLIDGEPRVLRDLLKVGLQRGGFCC
jgi:hypothetical protein